MILDHPVYPISLRIAWDAPEGCPGARALDARLRETLGGDPAELGRLGLVQARVEQEPNGYRLTGAKTWISNSPIADIAVVWAKLDGKIRGFAKVTQDLTQQRHVQALEAAARNVNEFIWFGL